MTSVTIHFTVNTLEEAVALRKKIETIVTLEKSDTIYISDNGVSLSTINPLGALKELRKEGIFPD